MVVLDTVLNIQYRGVQKGASALPTSRARSCGIYCSRANIHFNLVF